MQNGKISIAGDLNMGFKTGRIVDYAYSWKHAIQIHDLHYLINILTRVTVLCETIISHIYTSISCNSADISIVTVAMSDHCPIYFPDLLQKLSLNVKTIFLFVIVSSKILMKINILKISQTKLKMIIWKAQGVPQ